MPIIRLGFAGVIAALALAGCASSSSTTAAAAPATHSATASATATVPATASASAPAAGLVSPTAPPTAASCPALMAAWYTGVNNTGNPNSAGPGGAKAVIANLHAYWTDSAGEKTLSTHYADVHGMLGAVLTDQGQPSLAPPSCDVAAVNAWNQGLKDLNTAASIEQLSKTLGGYDATALADADDAWYQFVLVQDQA